MAVANEFVSLQNKFVCMKIIHSVAFRTLATVKKNPFTGSHKKIVQ